MAMCAIHNKRRGITNMKRMPDGTYTCVLGSHCKTGMRIWFVLLTMWRAHKKASSFHFKFVTKVRGSTYALGIITPSKFNKSQKPSREVGFSFWGWGGGQ